MARMRYTNNVRRWYLCLEGFRLVLDYPQIACLEDGTGCCVVLHRPKIVWLGEDHERRRDLRQP
jgi:hypothetical protein